MLLATRIYLAMALLIWAGASLAANMIAAPAKFQVADLTRPVALQVGRVQFQWVGYLEWVLAIVALLCFLTESGRVQLFVLIAVAAFVIQRFVVMPQLSEVTNHVIAGHSPGGSHLHLVFIGLEVTKLLALLVAAAMTLLTQSPYTGRN